MMSPLTVTLQVAYVENEQQFLLKAAEAAVRMFRTIQAKTGEVSSTKNTQEEPTPRLVPVS